MSRSVDLNIHLVLGKSEYPQHREFQAPYIFHSASSKYSEVEVAQINWYTIIGLARLTKADEKYLILDTPSRYVTWIDDHGKEQEHINNAKLPMRIQQSLLGAAKAELKGTGTLFWLYFRTAEEKELDERKEMANLGKAQRHANSCYEGYLSSDEEY